MRYLKTYKIFESNDSDDEVLSTISDMALDIKDDGFGVDVSKYSMHGDPSGTYGKIYICISLNVPTGLGLPGDAFNVSDISSFITRMDSYLSSNNFNELFIDYVHEPSDDDEPYDAKAKSVDEILDKRVSILKFFYNKKS